MTAPMMNTDYRHARTNAQPWKIVEEQGSRRELSAGAEQCDGLFWIGMRVNMQSLLLVFIFGISIGCFYCFICIMAVSICRIGFGIGHMKYLDIILRFTMYVTVQSFNINRSSAPVHYSPVNMMSRKTLRMVVS